MEPAIARERDRLRRPVAGNERPFAILAGSPYAGLASQSAPKIAEWSFRADEQIETEALIKIPLSAYERARNLRNHVSL
ncbi:MAG: hypothetical protein ACYDAE_18135 [Steroidobacteraceae bacterium]